MAQKFAKDQPAGFTNRIERVAIVGAGGNVGKYFAEALLKTGKHTVTAISREGSTSKFPDGVKIARVNYDDEASLVAGLQGQQFLVITLAAQGPPDTHSKLVAAAAKAGIPYVMPNNYGSDVENRKLCEENLYGLGSLQRIAEIEATGVSSWISMCCGFWYEWSLALGESCYGIDIRTKKATFLDDGKTKINTSTWEQCGKAIAGLLSLKEMPENANDKSPTVSSWKNKPLYISSFLVSQRDMLDSVNRVMGTTDKDWEIVFEKSNERYAKGVEDMKKGQRLGFARAMYSRGFYPNGGGDYESTKGLDNSKIGLGKDDLDAATKRTVEMVESGWNPFAGAN
ncbi:NAD(P)-binding protein [Stipitochalara longipes BDJ]|nr:NAD(P)-binding protein [Stipitochalara longipes BDJ]